jgi:hypothetical protein
MAIQKPDPNEAPNKNLRTVKFNPKQQARIDRIYAKVEEDEETGWAVLNVRNVDRLVVTEGIKALEKRYGIDKPKEAASAPPAEE